MDGGKVDMPSRNEATGRCLVCRRELPTAELAPAASVRPAILEMAGVDAAAWDRGGWICRDDLRRLRTDYVRGVLEHERGELGRIEEEVLRSLREQDLVSRNPDLEFETRLTYGERLADRIATFGGSWTFIVSFAVVLAVWVTINALALLGRPFDPYPFILLNLVLSCLAAVQAPVIMMSQNRQEAKDRLRAEHDYRVNLKAELEIRQLHAKIDQLLSHQWQHLLEIQRIQLEMMQELEERSAPSSGEPKLGD